MNDRQVITVPDHRRLVFDALSLEYNTLRSEITEKTTRSHRTVTLLTAGAGAVAALVSSDAASARPWIIPLGVVFALAALGNWLQNARTIGKISEHIGQLECDINDHLAGRFNADRVIRWEMDHQGRNWFTRRLYGPGANPSSRNS